MRVGDHPEELIDRARGISGLAPTEQATLDRHLIAVTETFVRLQQLRHAADYDTTVRLDRTATVRNVDSVAKAFQIRSFAARNRRRNHTALRHQHEIHRH